MREMGDVCLLPWLGFFTSLSLLISLSLLTSFSLRQPAPHPSVLPTFGRLEAR